jgi:sec-independent protein translocase protein TatA
MVGDILQPTHLLFVLVVALLVLGPKRLPEVGRALGDGIRDFKSAISGESDDRQKDTGSLLTHDAPEPQPAEKHEFAHAAPEAPQKLEFTAESTEPAAEHEFAHDSPEPADKHEFAHEGAEPAGKPAEPSA